MLQSYISQLEHTSLEEDRIKAQVVPIIDDLTSYLYYDYNKQLHFIIKSDDKISENRKGIKVKNSILDIIGLGKDSFIDLICTQKEFENEFIQIIEQIIEYYQLNRSISKAIKFIIGKWYFFLGKSGSIELDELVVKGIIGELLFIKEYASEVDLRTIIDSWKGPESGLRDFNFDFFDVEVKVSSKEIGHVHTINGQIQLESGVGALYVYSVSLKKSDSINGITLEKLINEICFHIGEDSILLNDFFEKLERIGVLATETEFYNCYSFELRNILIVKITQTNLHEFLVFNSNTRISRLIYDYDFNGLEHTKITF